MSLAMFARPLAVVLLTLVLAPASLFAQAGRYDSFYVFGDSLADTGNVWLTTKVLRQDPAVPPSESPNLTYFQGRFSNGPVAFEYLWHALSGRAPGTPGALVPYIASPVLAPKGAVNFAFGGTGTPLLDQTPGGLYAPGLRGQVELFGLGLRGRKPSNKALYAIVTGANDYTPTDFNTPLTPPEVVSHIRNAIRRLYTLGARDIVVLSLPDIGLTPQALAQGTSETGSAITAMHNQLLGDAVVQLRRAHPSLRLRLIDTNVVFTRLREGILAQAPPNQPLAWALPALDTLLPPFVVPETGVQLPMSACLFVRPAACSDVPGVSPDGTFPRPALLFWDVVHPTTDAHQALAAYIYEQLAH
jgi:phospholipase/lecithinase/hemolysin